MFAVRDGAGRRVRERVADGEGGAELWWFAGLDAAPFFRFQIDGETYRHTLAITAGAGFDGDRILAGGFVTAGATVLGVGPVVRWLPLDAPSGRRQGLEARFTWMPARVPVVEGVVLYVVELGGDGRRVR